MSATVSDFFQKVAVMARNWWPTCSGLGGRHGSDWVAALLRIMHIEHYQLGEEYLAFFLLLVYRED